MKFTKKSTMIACAISCLTVANISTVLAAKPTNNGHAKSYKLQGPCAYLPAGRATEFHGNADKADLKLGMAGNQWVVFDKVLQGFNATLTNDSSEPAHHANQYVDGSGAKKDYWTLAELNADSRNFYVQLIPPGLVRKQIKSGCLTLGNDEERNFLPGNVQVDFDVFTSTNYTLMQDLAKNGFLTEAKPYIKNKLDLMVGVGNPQNIGADRFTADADFDKQFDIVMDLLSGDVKVSEVDHVNEGIHKAISKMYRAMDSYIRSVNPVDAITLTYHYGDDTTATKTQTAVEWLDDALSAVTTGNAGSPSITRPGTVSLYDHSLNSGCNNGAGAPRFCEFSILNKFNTHETRVHHVETPDGILAGDYSVGPVWISELGYQLVRNVPVEGMQGSIPAGVPTPASQVSDGTQVNAAATYSIALLKTSGNIENANAFIDYVRSAAGQANYTDGGFIGLTNAELDAGQCYSASKGVLTTTARNGGC